MQVAENAWEAPETPEIAQLLGLVRGRRHYPLSYQVVEHEEAGEFDYLMVETRSLLGMMFFLSQSVEVPERDVESETVKKAGPPLTLPRSSLFYLAPLFRYFIDKVYFRVRQSSCAWIFFRSSLSLFRSSSLCL